MPHEWCAGHSLHCILTFSYHFELCFESYGMLHLMKCCTWLVKSRGCSFRLGWVDVAGRAVGATWSATQPLNTTAQLEGLGNLQAHVHDVPPTHSGLTFVSFLGGASLATSLVTTWQCFLFRECIIIFLDFFLIGRGA